MLCSFCILPARLSAKSLTAKSQFRQHWQAFPFKFHVFLVHPFEKATLDIFDIALGTSLA